MKNNMTQKEKGQAWDAFLSDGGRYDGIRFENLVFEVLQREYPGNWKQTPRTHDGSKDFVLKHENIEYWAECKAYSKSISIHVISPTLIMALLEPVKRLIFFSRSRLNKNAISTLARYRAAQNKEILVYDGPALGSLILKHGDIAKAYFGTASPQIGLKGPRLYSRMILTKDAQIHLKQPRLIHRAGPEREVLHVNRFDVIRVDLLLKNNSVNRDLLVRISLDRKASPGEIEVFHAEEREENQSDENTLCRSVRLPPGHLKFEQLYLRTLDAGTKLQMPPVLIEHHNEPRIQHEFPAITVKKLFQVPLVGRQFKSIADRFKSQTSYASTPSVHAIAGRSGAGKSRLLRELSRIAMARGYLVHQYESEFSHVINSENLVRQIIANVNELPYFTQRESQEVVDRTREKSTLIRGRHPTADLVSEIVYDEKYDIKANASTAVETLVRSLANKRTALFFDNIQNRDAFFCNFIAALIAELENSQIPVVIGICFNKDLLLPGSEAELLMKKLRQLGASYSARYSFDSLVDFSKSDAEEFLSAALVGVDSEGPSLYKKTINMFFEYVELRPLTIWQALMFLTDRNILYLEDETVYVRSPESLRSSLRTLPDELQEILKERWVAITANASKLGIGKDGLLSALRRLYALAKATRGELLEFGVAPAELDFLERCGIVKVGSGGGYLFFHYQVFVFYSSLGAFNFPKREALGIRDKLLKFRLSARLYQQFFIITYYAGAISPRAVDVFISRLFNVGPTREYGLTACRIFLAVLEGGQIRLLTDRRIRGITRAGRVLGEDSSLEEAAETLERLFKARLIEDSSVLKYGMSYSEFLHDLANHYLATDQDSKCLEVLSFALARLEHLEFGATKQRIISRCRLLNRRMATNKALGLLQEARADGKEAIALSDTHGLRELQILNCLDYGSVSAKSMRWRKDMDTYWGRAIWLYETNDEGLDSHIRLRVAYVRALLLLREGSYMEAYNVLCSEIAFAEAKRNHFWGVRLILVQIASLILEGSVSSSTLERKLVDVRDWWSAYGVTRMGRVILYLEGKYLQQTGSYLKAASRYRDALHALPDLANQHAGRLRYKGFVDDIIIACREMEQPVSRFGKGMPRGYGILQRSTLVETLKRERFEILRKEHLSTALLSNGTIALIWG